MRTGFTLLTIAMLLSTGVMAQNLLVNGDFDAAATDYKPVPVTANGWTSWTAGWGTMNSIDTAAGAWIDNPGSVTEFGNYSFRTGGLDWQTNGASGILQTVSGLTPGETYTLEFKTHHTCQNDDGAWQSGFYEVGVIDDINDPQDPGGGSDDILALWKVEGLNGTGDWVDRDLNFTAPADGDVTLFIKLGRTSSNTTTLWVDELSLTADSGPTPSANVEDYGLYR